VTGEAPSAAPKRRFERADVHQHLWTEGLLGALAVRKAPPRLTRRDGGWRLELSGEAPFAMDRAAEDPRDRAAGLATLGVDTAFVALSAALGVETLPEDEARAVIAAWDADTEELPGGLRTWGSLALVRPRPGDVDALLDRGRAGLTLPATALATPSDLDRLGAVLERLGERDAPLFIHPGPAPAGAWLPALTAYLAALTQAWLAWVLHGRARHPRLRVVFAALAGLAPLHGERLRARVPEASVDAALADPLTFYETSSYGPRAVEAMAATVGSGALVHGSDWPYANPTPPPADLERALLAENPAALLGEVAA
jgi:6-methylsalicylate decarboxylase